MRRDALTNIFPAPKGMRERIKLATHLSGRWPNIYLMYLAHAEVELTNAFIGALQAGTDPETALRVTLEKLDTEEELKENATSIGAERAKHAVQIASAAPAPPKRRTVGSWLRGE